MYRKLPYVSRGALPPSLVLLYIPAEASLQYIHIIIRISIPSYTKNSKQGIEFLHSSLSNLVEPLQKITPAMTVDKQEEYETLLGNKIPNEVDIHPPTDITSKGRSKRIRKSKEPKTGSGSKGKKKRKCRKCKQVADHDARNCPNNVVG